MIKKILLGICISIFSLSGIGHGQVNENEVEKFFQNRKYRKHSMDWNKTVRAYLDSEFKKFPKGSFGYNQATIIKNLLTKRDPQLQAPPFLDIRVCEPGDLGMLSLNGRFVPYVKIFQILDEDRALVKCSFDKDADSDEWSDPILWKAQKGVAWTGTRATEGKIMTLGLIMFKRTNDYVYTNRLGNRRQVPAYEVLSNWGEIVQKYRTSVQNKNSTPAGKPAAPPKVAKNPPKVMPPKTMPGKTGDGIAEAKKEIEKLTAQAKNKIKEVENIFAVETQKIKTKYTARLQAEIVKAKTAGKIDEVQAIMKVMNELNSMNVKLAGPSPKKTPKIDDKFPKGESLKKHSAEDVVGNWHWYNGKWFTFYFRSDKSCSWDLGGKVRPYGTWKFDDKTQRLEVMNGKTKRKGYMQFSEDGNLLTGADHPIVARSGIAGNIGVKKPVAGKEN